MLIKPKTTLPNLSMSEQENKNSLKQRAIGGIIWSTLSNYGRTTITFLISLVLARILMPKDFGLIGMLFIFIAVSRSLVDSGFGSALVQKRDTDQLDYNTIFYFNLFVSAVCYGVIYLSAPLIS